MVWMQPAHFSFFHGLDATSPFFFSSGAGCNQSIFSVQVLLIHDHTTLHHDCSIIADLFETQDNWHVLFWWLFNNIMMIAILACTSIKRSAMPQTHALSTRCQCLLRSSGGGRAAVVAAEQLLQPGESKKNHDARAGLLLVQWGQQGWAGWWGGHSY
jgi:hypothetical protein